MKSPRTTISGWSPLKRIAAVGLAGALLTGGGVIKFTDDDAPKPTAAPVDVGAGVPDAVLLDFARPTGDNDARTGTYLGALDDEPNVFVSLTMDGNSIRAYVCDGASFGHWFNGQVFGSSFALTNAAGTRLSGVVGDGRVVGSYTTDDGMVKSFTASLPLGSGGLFRAEKDLDVGTVLGGWIVHDDGEVRGVATMTDETGAATTAPAPPIDAAATRVEPTATLDVGPVPVQEVTVASLAGPVSTEASAAQQTRPTAGVTEVAATEPAPTTVPPAVGVPPALTAKFDPAKVVASGTSRWTGTMNNPGTVDLIDVGFTLAFPDPVVPVLGTSTTTCAGSVAEVDPTKRIAGDPQVVVVGVALAAGASCTMSIEVTVAPGAFKVVTGAPTAVNASGPGAVAVATVEAGAAPIAAPTATTTTATTATTTTTVPAATTTATTTPAATTNPQATTTPTTTTPAATTNPQATTTPTTTTTTIKGAPTAVAAPGPPLTVTASSQFGASPLSVTLTPTLPTGSPSPKNWSITFSDASPQVTGTGDLIPVPKTFVNETKSPLLLQADVQVNLSDGTVSRAGITFSVVAKGSPARVLNAAISTPAERGKNLTVPIQVINGEPTAFTPQAISFSADGLTKVGGAGWTCDKFSCVIGAPIAPGTSSVPLTLSFEPVKLSTAASLVVTYSGGLAGTFAIRVVGFKADAGLDQTVDARQTTGASGESSPTRVILDASGSTASVGAAPRTFTWRQTAGPAITFVANADPSGQRAMFDVPATLTANLALSFEITVTDGTFTDKDTATITVLRPNRPPTVVAASTLAPNADGVIVPAAGVASIPLQATVADPDGDAVTVVWRIADVPTAVFTITGPTKATLAWPIASRSFVIVEAVATDALGRATVDTVAIGTPPAALTLTVVADKITSEGGSIVKLTATPSRTTGVAVKWTQVSGDVGVLATPDAAVTNVTLPSTAGGSRVLVFRATATPKDGTAVIAADISLVASPPTQIAIVLTPQQTVAQATKVTLAATITRPTGATISWSHLTGPPITFATATAATASFTAPSTNTVIVVRVSVTNGATVVSADQVVNVGPPPVAATGSGCLPGSVLGRIFAGERVLLIGSASTVLLGDVVGATGTCSAGATPTFTGTGINLFNFITGENLSGTIDATKMCFTSGTVRLASKFDLSPITIGTIPLCLVYASVGGAAGASTGRPSGFANPSRTRACDFPLTGELRFPGDVPFVTLPTDITPGETIISVDCDTLRLTSTATFVDGGSLGFNGAIDVVGAGTTTVTASGLTLFGGTVNGTVTVEYGTGLNFSGALEILDPTLAFGDGVRLDRLAVTFKDRKVTVEGRITLGSAEPRLQLDLAGTFAGKTNFNLSVKASTTSAWTPTPGLTIAAASMTGTISKTIAGIVVDVTATASGDWRVLPSVSVRSITLQVGNGTVPTECPGIAPRSTFIRLGGVTDVAIPGRSALTTQIDACLGLPGTKPTGEPTSTQPAFVLRSLSTMPPLRPNPAVDISIDRLELRVSYIEGELEATLRGDARILGLGMTARLLFKTAPSGDVLVIVASGDVSGLGTPIRTGTVLFASSAVNDVEIDTGLVVDVAAGLSLISTIDLAVAQQQLLNDILKPPTPITGTLIVSATLGGPDLVLTAALDFGPNGIELFKTCPTAPCNATDKNTTLFRLDSGFITVSIGTAGFQLGIGGQGTLFLPPGEAKAGSTRSELQLRVEAFFRPPAEVGISFSLLSPTGWQNAAGIQGLTVNALVVQGSIDFTVPTAPIPSIGLLAEVSNLPPDLAKLIGFTNNGEQVRLAINIAPKNPILEITIGQPDGRAVLKPLINVDGAATGLDNSLTVDNASLVFAPLGGKIGPITYAPGISLRFGATLVGTLIEVEATLDIAALRIKANLSIGSFPIGGVTVQNTQLLLDIQPLGFRMRITGGVNIPDGPALSANFDVQFGVLAAIDQSGPPAPSTSLPRPVAGISIVADLTAANWQIASGAALTELALHGEGTLSALSGSIDLSFGVKASATLLGQTMALSGESRITGGELTELHVRVNPGNINVAGVVLGGDGTCQSSLVSAPATVAANRTPALGSLGSLGKGAVTSGALTSVATAAAPRLGTSGPCVQLDYIKDASPPLAMGAKGSLTAGSVKAAVVGVLDDRKLEMQGTVVLGELGALSVSGVLFHGSDTSLAVFRTRVKDEAALVRPQKGSWRFTGRFASGKTLQGVNIPWEFSLGSVDPHGPRTRVTWAQISGEVTRPGFTAAVKGDISFNSSGVMQYSITGTSALKIDESSLTINPNPNSAQDPVRNVLHGAIRPVVFALDPSPASHQRGIEETRGKLVGSASYTLSVRITNTDPSNNFTFAGSADVFYAEGFRRSGASSFTDEARSEWNRPVALAIDINSDTGKACFRWGDPGDFAVQQWGSC